MSDHCGTSEEFVGEVKKSEDAVGCDLMILENIPADMLEYALEFIYTDSCELLVHRAKPRVPVAQTGPTKVGKINKPVSVFAIAVKNGRLSLFNQDDAICFGQESSEEKLISSLQDLNVRGRSALEVYRSIPPAAKEDVKTKSKNAKPGKKAKGGKGDKAGANEGGANPVKILQTIAKKLGLGSLSAR